MRTPMMGQAKEHYKSYKAGKRWVYASITVIALGLGLTGITTAQAAVAPATDPATTEVAKDDAGAQSEVKEEVKPEVEKNDVQSDKLSDADQNQKPEAPESDELDPEDKVQQDKEPVQDDVQSGKENVISDVKTPGETNQDEQSAQTLQKSRMSRANLVKEAPSIVGQSADEWMPDKATQNWVIYAVKQFEANVNHNAYAFVTPANLYQYVSDGINFAYLSTDSAGYGKIQDLTGLQYFTNMKSFHWDNALPDNGLIDMSFAPNLVDYQLDSSGHAMNLNMSLATFLNTYLKQNLKLQELVVSHAGLTGTLDGIEAYQDLNGLHLMGNQLTGDLTPATKLSKLTGLHVSDNQLTGELPAPSTWAGLTQLDVQDNQLSGILPDFSGYNGKFWGMENHFGSGLSYVAVYYETVTGKTYKLTPKVQSFDPLTNVVVGIQGADGKLDQTDAIVPLRFSSGATVVAGVPTPGMKGAAVDGWAWTQTDASSLFKFSADADNPLGFTMTAVGDVPDGSYTLFLENANYNTSDNCYFGYLTFNIVNGEDPVDPVTPVDPTPGVTTGTVTVVNVDENGNVISQHVETGTVGDSYTVTAPELDGYQLTSPSSVTGTYTTAGSTVTFTYSSLAQGGDGATIEEPAAKPETGHGEIVNGGDGDKVVNTVANKGGQAAKAQAGHATMLASHKNAAAAQQTTKTTLPQTNESSSTSWIAAGMAVLVATLGLAGFRNKRHN
ncbi:MucBP domain-containing protein [Levilactobacillus lindianensis]|uniref:MucBP domain-containing protein n=1 Tax=Levilactobacillus lindianensis TaxID=2486018 RepID=UPI0013DD8D22|nr:MucBP domain-containing protein [Levilactobacillus lindianensis]